MRRGGSGDGGKGSARQEARAPVALGEDTYDAGRVVHSGAGGAFRVASVAVTMDAFALSSDEDEEAVGDQAAKAHKHMSARQRRQLKKGLGVAAGGEGSEGEEAPVIPSAPKPKPAPRPASAPVARTEAPKVVPRGKQSKLKKIKQKCRPLPMQDASIQACTMHHVVGSVQVRRPR